MFLRTRFGGVCSVSLSLSSDPWRFKTIVWGYQWLWWYARKPWAYCDIGVTHAQSKSDKRAPGNFVDHQHPLKFNNEGRWVASGANASSRGATGRHEPYWVLRPYGASYGSSEPLLAYSTAAAWSTSDLNGPQWTANISLYQICWSSLIKWLLRMLLPCTKLRLSPPHVYLYYANKGNRLLWM